MKEEECPYKDRQTGSRRDQKKRVSDCHVSVLQTDNHASTSPLSFLQAGCPSCHPTNSVKALKAF